MRTLLRLGVDGPPVVASTGLVTFVVAPALPEVLQLLLFYGGLATVVILWLTYGADSAIAFWTIPWRVVVRLAKPWGRLLPGFVWDLRPLFFGIAAWQSAMEGPHPAGTIGAVVLVVLCALTYVTPWCRKQLDAHHVTAPQHGQVQPNA